MLEAKAEDKILATRPAWPQRLNITGLSVSFKMQMPYRIVSYGPIVVRL